MVPETAIPAPLDRTLSYRLHLVNKLTDKSSADAYAQEFGLPVGQARCLAAIGRFAPLSVVDLAAKSNLDKAQASRASQALVVAWSPSCPAKTTPAAWC
jgi:DNA-binding MarR family transcriptional regulator